MHFYYDAYKKSLNEIYENTANEILQVCLASYENSISDEDDFKVSVPQKMINDRVILDVENDLMELREEKYEKKKNNLLEAFFSDSAADSAEEVLVKTYFYQNWREYVLDKTEPIIEECIEERKSIIDSIKNDVVCQYVDRLKMILGQKQSKKRELSNKLSKDSRLLQEDRDWISIFDHKLTAIEGR